MRRVWSVPCVLGVALVVAGPVATARATTAAVTLRASATVISYGQYVRFSGHVSPRSGGQTVSVLTGHGQVLGKATTASDGTYHVRAKPGRNMWVHAKWGAVSSDPVSIGVRPLLSASRTAIRLFGVTVVTGSQIGRAHV